MPLVYEGKTINKKIYNNLSPSEYSFFVESIFRYYRNNGFPFINFSKEKRNLKFQKLRNYTTQLILDQTIIQRMEGLSLAWHYFPHVWNIPVNGISHTPMDVFNDDTLFQSAIRKRLKFGDNISDNGIRKALMVFGTQRVSNFRPTAARAIYHRYLPHGGITWDMSCGFGGRLLGALSLSNIQYIGTDPCAITVQGLQDIIADFDKLNKATIYPLGSEIWCPEKQSLDLCFTSPPYFNMERYSEEPSQSYKKFETPQLWLNGFLRKTIQNCYFGLKNGCFMIINIANVKTYPNLVSDTITVAQEEGFVLHETLRLMLSKVPSVHGSEKITHKFEPVLVFRKM